MKERTDSQTNLGTKEEPTVRLTKRRYEEKKNINMKVESQGRKTDSQTN